MTYANIVHMYQTTVLLFKSSLFVFLWSANYSITGKLWQLNCLQVFNKFLFSHFFGSVYIFRVWHQKSGHTQTNECAFCAGGDKLQSAYFFLNRSLTIVFYIYLVYLATSDANKEDYLYICIHAYSLCLFKLW